MGGNSSSKRWEDFGTTCSPAQVQESDQRMGPNWEPTANCDSTRTKLAATRQAIGKIRA